MCACVCGCAASVCIASNGSCQICISELHLQLSNRNVGTYFTDYNNSNNYNNRHHSTQCVLIDDAAAPAEIRLTHMNARKCADSYERMRVNVCVECVCVCIAPHNMYIPVIHGRDNVAKRTLCPFA